MGHWYANCALCSLFQQKLINNFCYIFVAAGQERYKSVTRSYYRGASGAVIIYDVTNRSSYKHVQDWLNDAKELGGFAILPLLVGNKCDCEPALRQVQFLEASEFAQQCGTYI